MRSFSLAVGALFLGCSDPTPALVPQAEVDPAPQLAMEQVLPDPVQVPPRDATLVGLADVLPEVAEASVQSVVSVATRRSMQGYRYTPLGFAPPQVQQGVGSGVIVRPDGIVVTNNHVVEGADTVVVTVNGDKQVLAEVVGTDPKTDLAVLRLVDPPDDLRPLPFGDSDALRLGEVVLAVGTPFGIGQTVTMGIVSAKGRADMGIVDYEDFIQTDAAINPGNSGGALVDLDGTLVGINTAIFSRSGGSQGIGFAIPASMASAVVEAILDHGVVDRGWLGIALQDLDPADREVLGIDGGVLVADVRGGTPAAAAGLRRGDIVVSFQGLPVPDAARFRNRVAAAGSNTPFEIVVARSGKPTALNGVLGRLPTR